MVYYVKQSFEYCIKLFMLLHSFTFLLVTNLLVPSIGITVAPIIVKAEITSVNFIFETYSPYGLIRIFEFSDKDWNISTGCLQDMYTFLEGLKDGDLWAVKLYDANSYYSGGQYAGYNYRINNPNICRQLHREYLNSVTMHWSLKSNMTTVPFPVQLIVAKYGIEFINDFTNYHEIHQMICFPRTCNLRDLDQILAAVIIIPDTVVTNVTYNGARTITETYKFTEDVSFYVLMALLTSILVIFIMTTFCSHWMESSDNETNSTIKRLKSVLKTTNIHHNGTVTEGVYSSNGIKPNKNLKSVGLERAMEQFKKLSDYDISSSKNFKEYPLCGDTRMTINNVDCKDYVNLVKVKKTKGKDLSTITLDIITENGEIDKPIQKSFNVEREHLLKDLLQCFSLTKTLNDLSKKNFEEEELTVIRSLQTLCTIGIILINSYNHMEIISNNYGSEEESFILELISYVVRDQTTYFIDMFFFLSGVSLSYLYYKTSYKIESPHAFEQLMHFIGITAYKICSIILTYTILLICLELISKYFYDNTVLEIPSKDFINCDLHKWKNVLFIDTFFPIEDRCMIWSWLISLEVQFFFGGSLILLLAQIHPKYAASIFFTLILFSIITFLMLEMDPMTLYFEEVTQHTVWLNLNLLFDNSWLRILPYLLGMCLGYIIQKTYGRFKANRATIIFGWTISILIVGIYFYGLPLIISRVNLWIRAAAITMSHVAWNMILSWTILSSLSDYGGFLTSILNSKLIFTFGKLTNTAILLNPLIIKIVLLSGETGILLTGGQMIMMFIGFTITTYFCALILHIFFEAPLLSALRVMYQWQFH